MSIWNDIVNFFGGEVKEKDKNVDTKPFKEKEDELLKELEKQDSEYRKKQDENKADLSEIMPTDPNYKFLEYEGDSEADIIKKVAEQLGKESKLEKEKALIDFENKKNKKNEKITELDDDSKKQLYDLNEKYKALQEKNQESVLSNGMARSSIKEQSEIAIDEGKNDKEKQMNSDFERKFGDINKQLEILEKQENQAISELDLHYASKIQDKIKSLKDERTKAVEYIDKYNNGVIEKTNDYKKNREKTIQDYLHNEIVAESKREQDELVNGYSGDKKISYDNRLNTAIDFYKSLPKEAAIKMINENNYLKTYLGNNFGKLNSFFAK